MAEQFLHSPEYLHKRLAYNPDDGVLTWKRVTPCEKLTQRACEVINARFAGKAAGTYINSWGYRVVGVGKNLQLVHRVIWALWHGAWPGGEIDHINGDKLDNRIQNLRVVDGITNRRNMPMQRNNTSGHVGVCFKDGKWIARIGAGKRGKRLFLGKFDTIEEAVAARKEAEKQLGYSKTHGR
jgi:hypothetical protein